MKIILTISILLVIIASGMFFFADKDSAKKKGKPKSEMRMSAQPKAEKLPAGEDVCHRIIIKPNEWTKVRIPPKYNIYWDENCDPRVDLIIHGKRFPYDGKWHENISHIYVKSTKKGGVFFKFCFYKK